MAYEQRDNSGSMIHNPDKSGETMPDYSGSIMVAGKLYFCDAWEKSTRDGKAMFSIRVKEKKAQAPAPAPEPRSAPAPRQAPKSSTGFDDMNDDIPF